MDKSINLAKQSTVESIWTSANVEGLGTPLSKVEAILNNKQVETTREEVLFICNMKKAWDFLLETVGYEINLSILREFNKIVGDSLFYGNGEIRERDVRISGTTWKPDIPLPTYESEVIRKLLKISNNKLKALEMFCYVARTQLFIDGNKRVAQLIANKILIENNIGILQIKPNDLSQFRILLVEFYETNNNQKLVEFLSNYCIKETYYEEGREEI